MIEEALRTVVAAHSGVAGYVTSGGVARIYPSIVPEDGSYPCLVYQQISNSYRHNLEQSSGLATSRFQFTAWADSQLTASLLAEQLRQALDNYTGTSAGVVITHTESANAMDTLEESPEQELNRRFGKQMDFMVTYQETIP